MLLRRPGLRVSIPAALPDSFAPKLEVVDGVVPALEPPDIQSYGFSELVAEDGVVLAVEVERVYHDVNRTVLDDFEKIADRDVKEAIWVVMTRQGGHDGLSALNDPPDGNPRVEKTYSGNTPPQQFRIDTPGLTAIYRCSPSGTRYSTNKRDSDGDT